MALRQELDRRKIDINPFAPLMLSDMHNKNRNREMKIKEIYLALDELLDKIQKRIKTNGEKLRKASADD